MQNLTKGMTALNGNNAYIFASANLRAKENTGSAVERLASFSNAHTVEELYRAAANAWNISEAEASAGIFDLAMANAVSDIRSAVPDPSVFAPLLYKYDCTNVKLAIKYRILGESADGHLMECGSIPSEVILKALKNGDWSCLPTHMKNAAEESESLYRKTGEARVIDLTLDRACFKAMKADAEKGGVQLISEIVSLRADGINLLSSMRLRNSGDVSLFERVFLPVGNVPYSAFVKNGVLADLPALYQTLNDGKLKNVIKTVCDGNLTIAEIEKLLEDTVLSLLPPIKYMAYGPEVVVRYLLVREAEITNCRIICAGLTNGKDTDSTKERMRSSYV